MRPLVDSLFVSREKLAFFVDATAAPIASISPVSSWVGYEISLIQPEIDRIIEMEGTEDIGIKTSGFAVFLQVRSSSFVLLIRLFNKEVADFYVFLCSRSDTVIILCSCLL